MDVILLKDVDGVGSKGEVAGVSDGYARNYLLPRKLAEVATPGRIAEVRRDMEEKADQERREAERAEDVRDMLSKTVLTIPAAAGQGEKLFGSITNQDIATAIYAARNIRIDKHRVLLEDHIKALGTYMVPVDVHQTVEHAEVKVIIVAKDE
jgi:large subunit ribosomal protein L9